MQDIQELYIDILDTKVYEEIYAKQYDVGRQAHIIVTRAGTPITLENISASLELKKPDNTVIMKSCVIQNNQVVIDLDRNTTVIAGRRIPYQLQLCDTSTKAIICTTTGYINIDKSTVTMDDVESSSDFSTFSDILLDITSKYDESKTYATQAKNSQDAAKVSETNTLASEKNAKQSEINAKASEQKSASSESNALSYKNAAEKSASAAKMSETHAAQSEVNAKSSESISSQKATSASSAEANAKAYMDSAKSYMDKTTTLYNTIDTKLNNKTRLLTQQEYDQLSTIEKKNGTIYFVK